MRGAQCATVKDGHGRRRPAAPPPPGAGTFAGSAGTRVANVPPPSLLPDIALDEALPLWRRPYSQLTWLGHGERAVADGSPSGSGDRDAAGSRAALYHGNNLGGGVGHDPGGVPPNATLVAPDMLPPVMVTLVPAAPEVGATLLTRESRKW
jgi:hypothetical protein